MTPPRWLHQFFRFSTPSSRPDLEGDFLELYAASIGTQPRWRLHLRWVLACLRLWPLHLIIPKEKRNTTPILMFRTYLKIGRRNLMKGKAYAFINVLGLAVGLAACILITLYVRDELSFDTHIAEQENVYRVAAYYETGGDEPTPTAATSYLVRPLIAQNMANIAHITRMRYTAGLVEVGDRKFEDDALVLVDSSYFQVFPFPFLQGDYRAMHDPSAVVISQSMATKYFGQANPMGQFIEVREQPFRIAGIIQDIPHNTHFTADVFLPLHGTLNWLSGWETTNATGYSVYTYLRTLQPLNEAAFNANINGLLEDQWADATPPQFFAQPLAQIHLGSDLNDELAANGSHRVIYIFSATALIILLLACINYVNLSLAASMQRSKEVGMKKVLGASRLSQILQFQVESLLVTFTAGIIALALVSLVLPSFNLLTGKILTFSQAFDLPLLLSLVAVVMLVGLVTGAFPAAYLLKIPTLRSLTGNLLTRSGRKLSLRNALVTVQFFMAITLIVSTLSILNQVNYLKNKDLGIDPAGVVVFSLRTPQMAAQYEVLREKLLQQPGVRSVSATSNSVTTRVGGWRPYRTEGMEDAVTCPTVVVSHDFFETLGAKLVEGRVYDRAYPTDETEAYVINQAAVEFFGFEQAVGSILQGQAFTGAEWSTKDARVVGVVQDFHFASLHESVRPTVFSLHSDITAGIGQVQVRLAPGALESTIPLLESTWNSFNSDRSFAYTLMQDELQAHYASEDSFLRILSSFTLLSVLIGCLGLFGITAFIMKRRTQEVGIRKVLGASKSSLVYLLSRDFLALILIANLLGWPLAYYFVQDWVQNFAYQAPFAWWILLLTGAGAILLAFGTILYHTLRVTHTNPVKAIRYE